MRNLTSVAIEPTGWEDDESVPYQPPHRQPTDIDAPVVQLYQTGIDEVEFLRRSAERTAHPDLRGEHEPDSIPPRDSGIRETKPSRKRHIVGVR